MTSKSRSAIWGLIPSVLSAARHGQVAESPELGAEAKRASGFSARRNFVSMLKAQQAKMRALSHDPPRTRTWNLRLRRPTPYPLGQRASWARFRTGPFAISTLARRIRRPLPGLRPRQTAPAGRERRMSGGSRGRAARREAATRACAIAPSVGSAAARGEEGTPGFEPGTC